MTTTELTTDDCRLMTSNKKGGPKMFRLVHVREHERGLWFRRGDFKDLILPGSTWLLNWQDRIDVVDVIKTPRFDHPLIDLLVEKPTLREQLIVVDLDSMQRAIVWKDG